MLLLMEDGTVHRSRFTAYGATHRFSYCVRKINSSEPLSTCMFTS